MAWKSLIGRLAPRTPADLLLRCRTTVVDEVYFDLNVRFARNGRCGNNGGGSYAFGLERELSGRRE